MIASIAPLKRLPRSSSIFDYAVPHDLEKNIQPGQLVIVEFRKKKEYGIVLSTSTTMNTDYAYKPLDSIVHTTPLFLLQHRQLLREISILYGVSIATLCKTSVLPLQKRKLKKLELLPDSAPFSTKPASSNSYFLYQNEVEHALLFSQIKNFHTTLILVPEISKLSSVEKFATNNSSAKIIVWRSDLSIKEKFDLWLQIRNNTEPLIVIGTRSAITLPFTRLDQIIMDFEHDEQYKNYDQQPKFHTRDMVGILTRLYACNCTYASFSPSFELYYSIVKDTLLCNMGTRTYTSGLLFTTQGRADSIRIIEHTQFSQKDQVCSITTEEAIVTRARENTTDIVILVQRKGYATMVICSDCGHVETSLDARLPMIYRKETKMMYAPYSSETRPLPLTCSVCASTKLRLQGIGTEKVATYFSHLFKKEGISLPVFRIDDNTESSVFGHLESTAPRLLIGTEKVLSYIRYNQTSIFAILDLDRFLAIPEYNSFEHIVHLIDEFNYHRYENSQLLFEVSSGEKNIFKLFAERDRVYRTELSLRQTLSYPPYQSMIKYTLSSVSPAHARTLANNLRHTIALRLTEHHIPATLSEIYETHPNFEKRKYWYGILLKTEAKYIPSIAELLHPFLPRECIVDIHPLSVLSP